MIDQTVEKHLSLLDYHCDELCSMKPEDSMFENRSKRTKNIFPKKISS